MGSFKPSIVEGVKDQNKLNDQSISLFLRA